MYKADRPIVLAMQLLAAIFLVAGCTANRPDVPDDASAEVAGAVVKTQTGLVQGVRAGVAEAFRGIPFAAPPVGELRWRPPQPAIAWEGVRSANAYGPHCAQPDSEILWFELDQVSEDCLNLNILRPLEEPFEPWPVMVWIHGGGYTNGSGNIARLNSPEFAAQGVILVTINYRLSAFGFMTHPALEAAHPDDIRGNYGLQDVVQALRWVQANIAAFGGDPRRVTVFGESAGAGIVNTLLVMPSTKGLFSGAIAQSAAVGLAPEPYVDRRAGFLPPANAVGQSLAGRLGLADPAAATAEAARQLRSVPTDEVLAALTDRDRFTPVIDGELVPDQVGALVAAGKGHQVPYMNGGNSWEASLGREIGGGFAPDFLARLMPAADKARLYPGLTGASLDDAIFGDLIVLSGSRYFAGQMARHGAPVYSYYFSYVATDRRGRVPGAAHTSDIAFVFRTLETESDLPDVSLADRKTSRLLSEYWVAFATNGAPNAYELPGWPRYAPESPLVLEIGDRVQVLDDPFAERMTYHIERGQALLERARAR